MPTNNLVNESAQDAALSKLTLLIPTYNRPQYLSRLLHYYAGKTSALRILILDSSATAAQQLNAELALKLQQNLQYLSFPTTLSFAEKLHAGLQLITTPYCAFCADDDLVFIDGLCKAIEFMDNHSDYACADGIYLNFNQVNANIHLCIEYANKGITANNTGARIFKLYQKYESLFYGVFKTSQALTIFSGVCRNKSLHYQELFQATAALLLGKSQRLPYFYAARQNCQPAEINRDKWQTYYWFVDNPQEFVEHFLIYRTELWNFYNNNHPEPQYSQNEFYKVIDITHAMYFGIGCPPDYFHTSLQNYWPDERFKNINKITDNICNELKSKPRLILELLIAKVVFYLPKLLPILYSVQSNKKLNKHIQKQTNVPWNCILPGELRWLVGVKHFQSTYKELCLYLKKP